MRVLAGGPTRDTESAMYRLHVDSLHAQGGFGVTYTERHFEIDVLHLPTSDPGGPRWHAEKLERVAEARHRMLGHCRDGGYDGLLMVDDDVIIGPGVLDRMWSVDADVVYGVFWTRADWGQPEGPDAPQVWDVHPYGFTPQTWEMLNREGVNEIAVSGGGACTLIRGRALNNGYYPLLRSLRYAGGMWYGEDRRFALECELRGIEQIAVTGLNIVHLHEDSQRTQAALAKARAMVGLG